MPVTNGLLCPARVSVSVTHPQQGMHCLGECLCALIYNCLCMGMWPVSVSVCQWLICNCLKRVADSVHWSVHCLMFMSSNLTQGVTNCAGCSHLRRTQKTCKNIYCSSPQEWDNTEKYRLLLIQETKDVHTMNSRYPWQKCNLTKLWWFCWAGFVPAAWCNRDVRGPAQWPPVLSHSNARPFSRTTCHLPLHKLHHHVTVRGILCRQL